MKNKFIVSFLLFILILVLSNCGEISEKNINNNKGNKIETQDYLKKGLDIVLAAQAVLSNNLLTAIQSSGTDGALAFCNERAIPLTDSISLALNAEIKRVSDKNRNIDNAANEMELAYIQQAKSDIVKFGKAKPKLQEINHKMVGYYPIVTNGLCLKCHGDSDKDIDEKTLSMINKKYPKDKATGYLANEIRGIWVVNMDK